MTIEFRLEGPFWGWPFWSGGLALRRGRRTFDHRILYRVAVLGWPFWIGGLALRRGGGGRWTFDHRVLYRAAVLGVAILDWRSCRMMDELLPD